MPKTKYVYQDYTPKKKLLQSNMIKSSTYSLERRAGILVVDKDGKIAIRKNKNTSNGIIWSLANARISGPGDDENIQKQAAKSCEEKTGLRTTTIDDHLGDFESDSSITRWYVTTQYEDNKAGWKGQDDTTKTLKWDLEASESEQTQEVKFVTLEQAKLNLRDPQDVYAIESYERKIIQERLSNVIDHRKCNKNGFPVFYHGTSSKHINSLRSGLDFSKCGSSNSVEELGKGFYVGTRFSYANTYSTLHFCYGGPLYESGTEPLVVEFELTKKFKDLKGYIHDKKLTKEQLEELGKSDYDYILSSEEASYYLENPDDFGMQICFTKKALDEKIVRYKSHESAIDLENTLLEETKRLKQKQIEKKDKLDRWELQSIKANDRLELVDLTEINNEYQATNIYTQLGYAYNIYQDNTKKHWLVKDYKKINPSKSSDDINKFVANELTANKIYRLAGITVARNKIIYEENKPYKIGSLFTKGNEIESPLKYSKLSDKQKQQFSSGLAIDILLLNKDFLGSQGRRNIIVDDKGNLVRIDQGACLNYRANGERKADFDSSTQIKIEDFINDNCHELKYNEEEITDIKKHINNVIQKLDLNAIKEIIEQNPFLTEVERRNIFKTISERLENIKRQCELLNQEKPVAVSRSKERKDKKLKEEEYKENERILTYLYDDDDINKYIENEASKSLGRFETQRTTFLNNKFSNYKIIIAPAIDVSGQYSPIRIIQASIFRIKPEDYPIKILLPINIGQNHWTTGEFILRKTIDNIKVESYLHNPYGGGNIPPNFQKEIEDTFKGSIPNPDNLKLEFEFHESKFKTKRQHDGVSCGVIVAREIIQRVKDQKLDKVQTQNCPEFRIKDIEENIVSVEKITKRSLGISYQNTKKYNEYGKKDKSIDYTEIAQKFFEDFILKAETDKKIDYKIFFQKAVNNKSFINNIRINLLDSNPQAYDFLFKENGELKPGYDFEILHEIGRIVEKNLTKLTPSKLILAAKELDFKNLKRLILNPKELKRTDENNNNFLHILAEATHNKIIELLKSKTTENKDKASNLREEYREFLTETFSNEKISHEILELINQKNSFGETCNDVEVKILRKIAPNVINPKTHWPQEFQHNIIREIPLPQISPVEIFIKNLESRLAKLKEGQVFSVELDLDGCFLEGNTSGVVGDPPYNKELFNSLLHIKSLVEAKKAEFQLNICSTATLNSSSETLSINDKIKYKGVETTKKAVIFEKLFELNSDRPLIQCSYGEKDDQILIFEKDEPVGHSKILNINSKFKNNITEQTDKKKVSFKRFSKEDGHLEKENARYFTLKTRLFAEGIKKLIISILTDADKEKDRRITLKYKRIIETLGLNLEDTETKEEALKNISNLSISKLQSTILINIDKNSSHPMFMGLEKITELGPKSKQTYYKRKVESLKDLMINEEIDNTKFETTLFVDNDPRYHEQNTTPTLCLCPQSTLVNSKGTTGTSRLINEVFFNNGKPKRITREYSGIEDLAKQMSDSRHLLNQFYHPEIHSDHVFFSTKSTTIGYAFREELEEELKKLVEREGLSAATYTKNINDDLCEILDSTEKRETIGKINAIFSRSIVTGDKSEEVDFDYKFGEETLITLAIKKLSPKDFNTFLTNCFDQIEEEEKGKNASLALAEILKQNKISRYSETIKYLIRRKYINLNQTNSQKQNLLHKILSEDTIDQNLIKFLLESGINPCSQDENGNSCLHIAARNSKCTEEIINLLITHKANKELKNNEGKTASDLATDTKIQELLKFTDKRKKEDEQKLDKIIKKVVQNSYSTNPDEEISNKINKLNLDNIEDENQIKELLYGLYNSYFYPESPDTFILKKNIEYKTLKKSIDTLLIKIINSPKHSSIITKNNNFLENELNFIHIISNKLREITPEDSSKKYQLTPNLESTLITLFNNLKESDIAVGYLKDGKPHSLLHDLIVINNADILKSFLNKCSDKSNLLSRILDLIIDYHDVQEIYNCEFNYITQELIGSLKEDQLKELYNLYKPLVPLIDEDRSEKLNEILNNIIEKIRKTDHDFEATKSVNDELIEKLEKKDYTKFKELLKEELEKVFSQQPYQLNLNYRKSKEEPRLGKLIEENSEDLFSGIDAMDEETISNLFRFINDGNKISEIFFSINNPEKQKSLIEHFKSQNTKIKIGEDSVNIIFFLLEHIITKTNHHIKENDSVIKDLLDNFEHQEDSHNPNSVLQLYLVISKKNLEIRKKIISSLATTDKNLFLKWHNHNNYNLLHYAAAKNEENIEEIISCLKDNTALPNINDINNQGQTPLELAILNQNILAIQVLLNNDAEPNIRNREDKHILEIAIENNNTQIIRILLENGALLDQAKISDCSHAIQAIFKENELRVFLSKGSKGDPEIKQFLEDNKKLLETTDLKYDNHHLIFFLIDENHDESIEYLIKNYPNILTQNKDGKSPLEYAEEKTTAKGKETYKRIKGAQNANISSLLEKVTNEELDDDNAIKTQLQQIDLTNLSKNEEQEITELLYLLCETKLENYNTTDKTWNHSNSSKFFPESLKYLISNVKKELLTTPIKTNDNKQFNLISLISHKAKTTTTMETELQEIVEILTQTHPARITTKELLKSTYYENTNDKTKSKAVELILTCKDKILKAKLIKKFQDSPQPEKIEFLVQIYQNKDTNEIFKESFNAFFENEEEKYQEIYDKINNSLSKSNLTTATNPEKENFLKEFLPKAPPPKKPEQQPPQIHFTRASQTKPKKYAAPAPSTRPQSATTLSTPTTFKQKHKEELKLQAGCYDKTDEVRDAIKTAIAVSIQGSLQLSKTHNIYAPEEILNKAKSPASKSHDPELKTILDSFSDLLSTNLARCGIKNTNFDQIDDSIISEVKLNDPNATTNFNQIAEKVSSVIKKQELEQARQATTGKFSSNLRNKVSGSRTAPTMRR